MKNLPVIKATCLALGLASLLVGCAKTTTPASNLLPTQTQTTGLNSVESIRLNGPFVINLQTGKKTSSQMSIYATNEQMKHVSIHQNGQNLTVTDNNFSNQPFPIQVTITDPSLRSLEIDHAQNVSIDAGNKGYFDLQLNDTKHVSFTGQAVLPNIQLRNSANLEIKQTVIVHNIYRTGQGNIILHLAQGNNINIDNNNGGGIYIDGSALGFNQIKQSGDGEIQIHSSQPIKQLNWISNRDIGQVQIHAPSISSKQFTMNGQDRSRTVVDNINAQSMQTQLSDYAQLKINGSTPLLTTNLQDHTKFLAKNLNTQITYVNAYNFSSAIFTVNRSLFANVGDQSIVEYLGHPQNKFIHAMNYASVLALSAPR